MKLKELIRQLQEYMKLYNGDMEVITRRMDDYDHVVEQTIDGIDYIGDSTILIVTHED